MYNANVSFNLFGKASAKITYKGTLKHFEKLCRSVKIKLDVMRYFCENVYTIGPQLMLNDVCALYVR